MKTNDTITQSAFLWTFGSLASMLSEAKISMLQDNSLSVSHALREELGGSIILLIGYVSLIRPMRKFHAQIIPGSNQTHQIDAQIFFKKGNENLIP